MASVSLPPHVIQAIEEELQTYAGNSSTGFDVELYRRLKRVAEASVAKMTTCPVCGHQKET